MGERYKDVFFTSEADLARMMNQTPAAWAAKVIILERQGFPKIDPIMGARYLPAVRAWWDRRYGLATGLWLRLMGSRTTMRSDYPTPGLKRRRRASGVVALYWTARSDIVRKGYTPKTVPLHYPDTPDYLPLISQACNRLQAEMLSWAAGQRQDYSHFDGTLEAFAGGLRSTKKALSKVGSGTPVDRSCVSWGPFTGLSGHGRCPP